LRGCRLRKAASCPCQVDEVHRRFHDPLWTGTSLLLILRDAITDDDELQPVRDFVDQAVRHVLLRQGVLGIKVKIMKAWDPTGVAGPSKPLPDVVTSASQVSIHSREMILTCDYPPVVEPKEDSPSSLVAAGQPVSEQARGATEIPAPAPVAAAPVQQVEEVAAVAVEGEASW
jgi:small subunit ribosomal protein S3e